LNHFTEPVISTDDPFDVVAWALDRREAVGAAVLLSAIYTQ
jgi:hypothetical protein